MRNTILISGYQTENATATADTTATGYDAQNAVTLDRTSTWKASGTSAGRLILNTTAAITPTGLGIANGNYSGWGTTKLQHSADGASWTDFLTLASLPGTDSTYDYFAKLTSAPSKSWWALYWASPSAAPEVGMFYLGAATTITRNHKYPAEEVDDFGVDQEDSIGKVTVAETVARPTMRFILSWKNEPSSERDEVREIIRTEKGPKRPFFYVPIDESGSSTEGRAYVVRYEPPTLSVVRRFLNAYEFVIPLREQV